jgi:LysM repeat protein
MTDQLTDDSGTLARSIFAGLVPQNTMEYESLRSHNPTLPILLIGSMTMAFAATSSAEAANASPEQKSPSTHTAKGLVLASVKKVAALPAPATYRVVAGDTVSGIASRYGLSTASVLALNGLSAKSLIFPGQVLKLTSGGMVPVSSVTPIASGSSYSIVRGDTISGIAGRFGVSTASILSANGLSRTSIIYPGQKISIPGALDAVPVSSVTPIDNAPAPTPDPPASPVVTPPAAVNGSYVIQSGDSISKIAAKFGVTVQAILDANGLTRTSIIYTGHTLVVPGVGTTTAGLTGVTLLSDEQSANAAVIVAVGRQLGVPDYGIVVALAAAMQESSLRNINYGHLDSVGLFQQRPSAGWGSVAQLTDATYAARLFYGGPSNPNKGKTRGLLDIAGWQSLTLTQAAQKVQVSAYPTAYAKWEASARFWFSELG